MKVGILGCGFVGATAGYSLVMRGVGREIVLVDKNRARADAEADDIRHAVPFAHQLVVRSGEIEDLKDARVVILCAGVGQKPGESRLALLQRNVEVFRAIVPPLLKVAPDAIIVVATNPVDIMTHYTARLAQGTPSSRVLGSGTTLDTARFRSLLGEHCGVDSHHVHAYVVGEHGDSEVLTWSLATIGGMPLEHFIEQRGLQLDAAMRQEIDRRVRNAAGTIIKGKGATYYGIGCALARITEAILKDQRSILTVCAPSSSVQGVDDVTLSLPRLVGGDGVLDTFPLPIDENEQYLLRASASILRQSIDEIEASRST